MSGGASPRPLLLRGGRVLDPASGLDRTLDVLLVDGRVARVREDVEAPEGTRVVDASGLVVCPGLIDVHVHLREPGGEHKETIATGARAAAAGGFTAVCAMPNTDPPPDGAAGVSWVAQRGREAGAARVYPTGCISVGRAGERLAPFGELAAAGAVAVTDDGSPVVDGGLMRLALEYAAAYDLVVADHPEDLDIAARGAMHEGAVSARLGLPGKPAAAEDLHIVRDLMLAELTGGRIHLQHVSTRGGVEAIRRAKERGVRVTAEASPHHLVLTDEAVGDYRTDAKMNPPLRTVADVEAVRRGVADGTLDVIATDHAPHHADEKAEPFPDAPNGVVGLETAVGVVLTRVVSEGVIDLPTLVRRMSTDPAKAFGLPGGTLEEGGPADVTMLDTEARWTVRSERFESLGRNTPFEGWDLTGRAVMTVVGGEVVWEPEPDGPGGE